ncbi:MAG TPA: hypothetical protein DCW88_25940 [Agrobacterium sp.]|nr:hypothetical protein DBL06_07840 [Agrobacterium pusense]HAU78837.1 hypothetical protein [Agrobacterium sp.]
MSSNAFMMASLFRAGCQAAPGGSSLFPPARHVLWWGAATFHVALLPHFQQISGKVGNYLTIRRKFFKANDAIRALPRDHAVHKHTVSA